MWFLIGAFLSFIRTGIVSVLVILLLYNLYSGVSDSLTLIFHTPDDKDYMSDTYKYEALCQADKYLTDNVEQPYWEGKGLTVIKPYSQSQFKNMIHRIISDNPYKKAMGKQIAYLGSNYLDSSTYLARYVSYKGNNIYHLIVSLEVTPETIFKDDTSSQDIGKRITREYYVVMKVERENLGLKWTVLEYYLRENSTSEERINQILNSLEQPITLKEYRQRNVQKKLKSQAAF